MRVTNGMMSNLVNFNMQRSLSRFVEMQTQASNGRRINKPSDDPLGTLLDLDYRAELKSIEQLRRNISVASEWQQNYDTVMADAKDMLSTARELAVSMSNSTYDETARAAAAVEIRSIYDHLINLANSEINGKTVFSGYKTDTAAFVGTYTGATFEGNDGVMELAVESRLSTQYNLIGSDTFLKQLSILGEDTDLNAAVTGSTLLGDLNGGTGIDLTGGATPGTITITDRNLNITSTIDFTAAPPATTVQDILDRINTQLTIDGITDITAQLGPSGNQIMFAASPSGIVTASTSLGVLNDGQGVDLATGQIMLRDGTNPDLPIDLSGATDLNDIITMFNAQAPANVLMQLDPVGNKGLQIVDSNGVPLGLEVIDASANSTLAQDLGILGQISPILTGTDLNPSISMNISETDGSTAADLGILGEFRSTFLGQDLNPRLTTDVLVTDLKNQLGMNLGTLIVRQGQVERTVDLGSSAITTVQDIIDAFHNTGLDITASINVAGTGIQVVNDDPNATFVIENDYSSDTTASDLGLYGSSDTLGSLLVLADALDRNDEDAVRKLVGNMEHAIEHSLTIRAQIGARWSRLETAEARQISHESAVTALLSETEDADIAKLVSDLATYENNYRVSLMATAKIIQPSLLDFLR
ncbi:MAG: flagellar hook-associated protein FlgL [bacterium]